MKFAVLVLVVIFAVTSNGIESCRYNGKTYRDGTSFMKDCNRCLCRNGRAACTKKACQELPITSPRPSQCGPLCKIYCPNGNEIDSRGCPICKCKPRSCPRRYCPRPCINGYRKDRRGCNTCICELSSETRSCRYNGKTYKDGTSFMKDCNRCLCRNGRAACTKKACQGLSITTPRPSQCGRLCKIYCPNGNEIDSRGCPICKCKPRSCPRRYCPRPCINGYKIDRRGCNTCICELSSRKRSCRYNGKTYKDGTSFIKDCNRCLCRNGRAVCTKKACQGNRSQDDN